MTYSFERAGRFRMALHLSSNDSLTPADFDAIAAWLGVVPHQAAKVSYVAARRAEAPERVDTFPNEAARLQVAATDFPEGFKVDGIAAG